MNLKSLLTTLLVFMFFVAAQAQTADEIIEKYFKAIGGKEKLKAMKTMTATVKMNMMGMDLPMTIYTKVPNKMKSIANFQGAEIIVAFDGKDAWQINPLMGSKEPQMLPMEQAKGMATKEVESEFIDYKTKGHTVTYQGTEMIDGVKCFKVEMVKNKNNDKDDITETYFFDAENYVPILVKTVAQGMEASTYMSDYQEVSGLMIPFLTEIKAQGQSQKMTFEKVTINDPIDDSIFAFPKK